MASVKPSNLYMTALKHARAVRNMRQAAAVGMLYLRRYRGCNVGFLRSARGSVVAVIFL